MDSRNFEMLLSNETIIYRTAQNHHGKFVSLSNQIQLKISASDLSKRKAIASDIKLCISHHLKSLDENEIHYDQIQLDLIFGYIDYVSENDRVILTKFALRKLRNFDHEDHIDYCLDRLNGYERLCLRHQGFWGFFKRLYLWSISGFFPIVLILFLFFTCFSILLLPSYYSWAYLYDISYVKISDNYYINHWFNTLGAFCGLFDDMKIIPRNFFGVLLMIITKLGFLLYVVNILSDQLLKRLNK
ncbi:MAG: hypothetical protein K0S33_3802 [Bacteroidetes bacterium]|jgi:hypothetical protein|nr:hypothetical protein [Bacteroidota bacterium]